MIQFKDKIVVRKNKEIEMMKNDKTREQLMNGIDQLYQKAFEKKLQQFYRKKFHIEKLLEEIQVLKIAIESKHRNIEN